MKGKLELRKIVTEEGSVLITVLVLGNVGDEGRRKLDALGMSPVPDISNCRARTVTTPDELDALRDALVNQGIVEGPPPQHPNAARFRR